MKREMEFRTGKDSRWTPYTNMNHFGYDAIKTLLNNDTIRVPEVILTYGDGTTSTFRLVTTCPFCGREY